MKTTHRLDQYEGTVRFALGIALLLIGWDYGFTLVGTGAVVLGVVALGTAIFGLSAVGRAQTVAPPTVKTAPSHLGHDVHDRAHEGHPLDTESL